MTVSKKVGLYLGKYVPYGEYLSDDGRHVIDPLGPMSRMPVRYYYWMHLVNIEVYILWYRIRKLFSKLH